MPCDQKLKILIDGISGSGKTVSSLRLATGIAEIEKSRIAMITSEPKAASWQARNFDFDIAAVESCSILNFTKILNEALKAGYKIIILDGFSDAYDGYNGYLEQAENIGRDPKQAGLNKWTLPTKQWRALLKLIVSCDAHIICTAKQKTENVQEKIVGDNGRSKVVIKRVGEKAILKEKTEFEFDFYITIDSEHVATFNKVRHDKYDRMKIKYMSEETGKQLLNDSNNLRQTYAQQQVAKAEVIDDDGLHQDIELAPEMETANNDFKKYNVDMQVDETPEPVADAATQSPVQPKPANTIPIKKPTVTYLSKEESDELIAIATETGYKREQIKAVLNKHGIVYLSKIPVDTKLILERIFKDKGYLIGM